MLRRPKKFEGYGGRKDKRKQGTGEEERGEKKQGKGDGTSHYLFKD